MAKNCGNLCSGILSAVDNVHGGGTIAHGVYLYLLFSS